jgi:hypothetical protein
MSKMDLRIQTAPQAELIMRALESELSVGVAMGSSSGESSAMTIGVGLDAELVMDDAGTIRRIS